MAALRHLCQTGLHDLMGAHALDALALVQDIARFGVEQAGDGFQGGGLTGTVGTDQGHDLALVQDVYKRQGVARTFQNIRLFKELSVIDNIKVGLHESMKYNPTPRIFHIPFIIQGNEKVVN